MTSSKISAQPIPEYKHIRIDEDGSRKWRIITARLGMPLGPRLLKSLDEDWPDKPHRGLTLAEAHKMAAWWDKWLEGQENPPKKAKK